MPVVSVIIPSFNSASTIKRAVDSVLEQTFQDFEIIIVDDASTDGGTRQLLGEYTGNPRIRVELLSENRGPSTARNRAIDLAKGRWIALLDADDAWMPSRLETLIGVAAGSDFVADNILGYDASSRLVTGPCFNPFGRQELLLEDFLAGRIGSQRVEVGWLKPLMRVEFLRDHHLAYNANLRFGEDYLLYCEALCLGARFRIVQHFGYVYSTPYGRHSREVSPHSHSRPDGQGMARNLLLVKDRYSAELSSARVKAFDRRAALLVGLDLWWEFEAAHFSRDWRKAGQALAASGIVRRLAARMFLAELLIIPIKKLLATTGGVTTLKPSEPR
jgi:succinoglycan biosynthesis protein ExoO